MRKIYDFIKGDRQALLASRFVWEIVAVFIGIGITWLIGHFTHNSQLQNCQDERSVLLQEKAQNQTILDSIKWSGLVVDKEIEIKRLKHELQIYREQAALDSAANHSELEAMRAINKRFAR